MDKKAETLFKQLYGKDKLLEEDPELKDIVLNYIYGDVYHYGNLDKKLRQLVLIVIDTTNHTLKTLQEHVIGAININVDPIVIKEAVYQCTPYIGLSKVIDSLEVINQVFKDKGIPLPLDLQATVVRETRFKKGFDCQGKIFGFKNIKANHDNAPNELKHIQSYLSEFCFGDFYTRKGLDLNMHELLTMVILTTLGGCENQLRAHIIGNINIGNSRELLLETITQCQPYIGFPRTLNAINIINEVTVK